MSLPSQTGTFRSSSGRSSSNMYRRRRNGHRPLLVGGGIALALVIGGWLILRGASGEAGEVDVAADSSQSSFQLGPQSAQAASRPAAPAPQPTPTTSSARQAEQTPVVELRQGSPERQSEAPSSSAPATTSTAASKPVDRTTVAPTPRQPSTQTPAFQNGSSTLAAAKQRLESGDLVTARVLFSRALRHSPSEAERAMIRAELTKINEELVFSRRVAADDPWAYTYRVQPNDSLVRINQREGLAPDWRLIQRVNGMSNPNRLQVGQSLKLLRGPFHAVVTKSNFRLDLYMGPADNEEEWLFIRSFSVGLGEGGSTPVGTFVVRRNSKLIDPHWVNPRTGEHFAADDPNNPIGDRWIGLEGIGDSAGYVGYGIHGTIEPETIGREESMGCVRMLDDDIELVYDLLGEQVSVVRIEP